MGSEISQRNISSVQLSDLKRVGYQTRTTQSLSTWGSVTFVIGMIILSWILTGVVSVAILRNRRTKHISYMYIVSMSVATVIHASLNFPSSVIFDLLDLKEFSDRLCIIWIFLETAICHSVLLHLLGSSLDTYLRLQMPQWYSLSGGRPATVRLKLAAPWIVSTLQTTAQVLLGDPLPPARLEEQRLCTCPDVNFLILRTSVAFAFPLLVSVIILFLAAHKLQCIYRPSFSKAVEDTNSTERFRFKLLRHAIQDQFTRILGSTHSALVYNLESMQNSAAVSSSEHASLSPSYPTKLQCQQVQSAPGSGSSDTGISSQTTDENEDALNFKRTTAIVSSSPMFTLERTGTIVSLLKSEPVNRTSAEPVTVMNHFCPQHGHVTLSLQPELNFKSILTPVVEHELATESGLIKTDNGCEYSDANTSTEANIELYPINLGAQPTLTSPLLLRTGEHQASRTDTTDGESPDVQPVPNESTLRVNNTLTRSISAPQYNIEQKSIKLNMITCALSIALWAPFITATLAHILLSTTRFSRLISVSTLIQFKWLSYMSSVAYLIGYLIVDHNLYRLVIQQCRKCHRKHQAHLNVSPVRSTKLKT